MSEASSLLDSLRSAVESRPDDSPLRLHLARLLIESGEPAEALEHCGIVLKADSANPEALSLLAGATHLLAGSTNTPGAAPAAADQSDGVGFDWHAAESQVADVVQPAFVNDASDEVDPAPADLEAPSVTLADVAGMATVKERLELAFLTPMRNPEIGRLYGANMRGGLLLYGPPGCGKTFLARALAGELGARFYPISLADVLDMWIGASERNLHEIFEIARRNTPCVLFLDEIDALGQKRSQLRNNSAMRGTVNQLLTELDSVKSNNDGVFVLAATNHPWDVDAALKRPGRLDRAVLVLPPDQPAREAILRLHLQDRPLSGINVAKIAKRTDGWSGADLAALTDRAAQQALADSVRSGEPRPIQQSDLEGAADEMAGSLAPWYDVARNVAQFSNAGGEYDDLLAHLKQRRLL